MRKRRKAITIANLYLLGELSRWDMAVLKSIGRILILIVSGIAIVVVGGFMMGAVAKLYLPGHKKDRQEPPQKFYDAKKAD